MRFSLMHLPAVLARMTFLGLAGGLIATTAVAADPEDMRALQGARITLIEAITAAEAHQGGRAVEAGIDDDSFTGPAFDVSIVRDATTFDVRVDGVTGKVIGAREDLDD